ncbi:MAG: cytochrome c oxidase subunit 4, partial [Actinobacteria bacterium]|nr:cytochrome c oxidase subunit 4 [Actinomycetota bacterium]
NAKLFWLLTVFYALASAGYTVWNIATTGEVEIIGTAAMAMLVFLAGLIAFYLQKAFKSQGPVPEDNPSANIEDGDGEIGFFNAFSWWPMFLGLFAAMSFASLAIGWWLFFIAVPLALIAVFGFVFENYRGQYAH